jgi:hypothetical protein
MLKVASNIFSPQTCADISHELWSMLRWWK